MKMTEALGENVAASGRKPIAAIRTAWQRSLNRPQKKIRHDSRV
jgi:hypothetical protein